MIRRSRKARADLVELALYYGEKNSAAAMKLLDRVEKTVDLLSRAPSWADRGPISVRA